MKKLLAIILALCLVFVLAACTPKAEEAPAEEAPAAEEEAPAEAEPLKFGVLWRTYADVWPTGVRLNMEKIFEEKGYEYEMLNADDDQAKQVEQLQTLLSKGVDVLLIQLCNAGAVTEYIETIDGKVTTIFFNNEPPDLSPVKNSETTLFVGSRSPEAGYMQADIFMELWDGDAKWDRNGDGIAQYVIFQGGSGSQEALDRSQFCVEGAEDEGYKFEKLADNFMCEWDNVKAMEAFTPWIANSANLDKIEVVFCNNDNMANGVIEALNGIGWNMGDGGDEVMVIGVDATEAGKELFKTGKLQGTVDQPTDLPAIAMIAIAPYMVEGMTADEAVAAAGYEIYEGDGASVRCPYAAYDGSY